MSQIIFKKRKWLDATTREEVSPKDGDEVVNLKCDYGWLQELRQKGFNLTMGERIKLHEPDHRHDTTT